MSWVTSFAPWEDDFAREMWPVSARMEAWKDGWRIEPIGDCYMMTWVSFHASGETLVEYLKAYMEAGTNPDLFDKAWAFYVWLRLHNQVRFGHYGNMF